jgi:hypothetical protein
VPKKKAVWEALIAAEKDSTIPGSNCFQETGLGKLACHAYGLGDWIELGKPLNVPGCKQVSPTYKLLRIDLESWGKCAYRSRVPQQVW